ncbi:MAG TPA: ATP-binding protein, partial [Candidatus Limnocylindrales bacterium]|nr:ATP-binding protein [Candidatus Limnocylindrales bacterium]
RALEREREANSALRRSEAELAAAGRAKDEFLGLVSHELKTPITTIYGDAVILERRSDGLDPAVRDSLVVDIRAESERLHSLIDDLLVLARGQQSEVEREPVMVRRLVDQVVQRERRSSGRLIEVEDAETDVTVEALPGYVEQVLRNLLSNAVKYSGPGSPVTIGIRSDPEAVAVEVRDRGIGFADDEIEQLFTPFYRSDRAAAVSSGVGIGLVVCKRVIEAHGGRIWARQRKRGGAAVGFELPRATVPHEP